jgi:hypothetical protein
MEQERGSGNEAAYSRARVRMLEALEAYAAGLATRGAPLPHRLQVELTVFRLLHRPADGAGDTLVNGVGIDRARVRRRPEPPRSR